MGRLSGNPNANHLLEKNQDKIDWERLSGNPNAIDLLQEHQDKINWEFYQQTQWPFIY